MAIGNVFESMYDQIGPTSQEIVSIPKSIQGTVKVDSKICCFIFFGLADIFIVTMREVAREHTGCVERAYEKESCDVASLLQTQVNSIQRYLDGCFIKLEAFLATIPMSQNASVLRIKMLFIK
ncbi:unnamed protein product [Albugo candida]|uniref:Uncharacterized protein n=1 Tax=Albugo candida TaxID=65357 RepID=A0A024GPN4_9STRA|nr:unnamed protein product [Albugo candida]|eukprot:CCI48842.1 unnamed protein product [Albugo candida]